MENKYFYGGLVVIVLVVIVAAIAMFPLNKDYTGKAVGDCYTYLTTSQNADVYLNNTVWGLGTYLFSTVANEGVKKKLNCGGPYTRTYVPHNLSYKHVIRVDTFSSGTKRIDIVFEQF